LYTIDKLRQDGHKIQGLFYNPNIYPQAEYKLRRQAVVDMAKRLNVKVTYKDMPVWPFRAGCSLALYFLWLRAKEKPGLRSQPAFAAAKLAEDCSEIAFRTVPQQYL